jgi:DNA-binding LacI/PurR family transcriptional regulator
VAIGLISGASSDGAIVPESLSVIGNDDIHEARYLLPAASTIEVDFHWEGRMLVEQLLLRLEPDLIAYAGGPSALCGSRIDPPPLSLLQRTGDQTLSRASCLEE